MHSVDLARLARVVSGVVGRAMSGLPRLVKHVDLLCLDELEQFLCGSFDMALAKRSGATAHRLVLRERRHVDAILLLVELESWHHESRRPLPQFR